MEFFSNAIQKAQASVDQALGIDATIANEAMGEFPSRLCRAFPTQMLASLHSCLHSPGKGIPPCRTHAVLPRYPPR
jgi:hypothetical protein